MGQKTFDLPKLLRSIKRKRFNGSQAQKDWAKDIWEKRLVEIEALLTNKPPYNISKNLMTHPSKYYHLLSELQDNFSMIDSGVLIKTREEKDLFKVIPNCCIPKLPKHGEDKKRSGSNKKSVEKV